MDNVRDQYERFPYPPIPWFALPRRGEGASLRVPSARRILVAGAGTFEAVVIAQANPQAEEVVAIDLSAQSLEILKRRYTLARITRFYRHWPKLTILREDLLAAAPGRFDAIFASNLVQHVSRPFVLLKNFKDWLNPDGVLRIVTYPRSSRIWMRQIAELLQASGIPPEKALKALQTLDPTDPRRAVFENHSEISTRAGLVDAFYNAHENPLSFLEWKSACENLGLHLTHEDQTETSRSTFLDEILGHPVLLDAWEKLQILDDLLEICANPVLWLKKSGTPKPVRLERDQEKFSDVEAELARNIKRAESLLTKVGIPLHDVIAALKREVGPREIPGTSILDYPELLAAAAGAAGAGAAAVGAAAAGADAPARL